MENPLIFAATVLGILFTPGPSNSLLATAGATVGFRLAWTLVAFETLAYILAVCFLHFALGPMIAKSPMIAGLVRLIVSAYLLWLAAKIIASPLARENSSVVSGRDVFITTLLNPKAIVFAFVIIPFESSTSSAYLLAFAILILCAGTTWLICGATIGRIARLSGRARIIPYAGASAMVFFALLIQIAPLKNAMATTQSATHLESGSTLQPE